MQEIPAPLETLAQALIQPGVILGYVAFLFGLFLLNLVLFSARFMRIRKGVLQGVSLLKPVGSEESFTERFDQVDEALTANPVFGEAWGEFTECLIFPQETGKPIQNSRDAAEYFHSSAVIDRHLSIRYYNSVPNILTGLGILGTFIGLAAGIGVAQAGLQQGEIEPMQRALGNLLGGASLAFITSIAGLALSLLFLGIERWSLGRLHRHLQGFVRKIDGVVSRITPERILTDHLVEMKAQTHQLKRFNTELAFQIAGALDEKIAGRLTPALDKLLGAVNELKEGQQSSSEETIRALVNEFRETMTGATGAEFDRISQTLQRIDEAMARTADQFGEREASLQDSMKDLLEEIGATLARNSRHMQSEVEGSVRTLLEAVGGSLTELQDALAKGRADAQTALDAASQRASREMEEGLQKATDALAAAAVGVADGMTHAGGSFSDQISESTRGLGDEIRELREHVRAVSAMAGSVGTAASQLTEASKGSELIVRRLGELEGVLRTAAEQIGRGSRSAEDAVTTVRDGVSRVHEAIEELNENQRNTAAAWTDYRSRFEGLDASLRNTFQELDSGVSRYTEQVTKFHNGMDRNLSTALETLGGAIRDLEEILEDFADRGGSL